MDPEKFLLELGFTRILGQVKDFWNFLYQFHEVIRQVDSDLPVCFVEILVVRRAASYSDAIIYKGVAPISLHLALPNKQGVFVTPFGIAGLAGKYFDIV